MKRRWLRKALAGFSLTSALFLFQACYGSPQDMEVDVFIKGFVKSQTTGLPVEGIKITLQSTSQSLFSDTSGGFSFYAPMANQYHLYYQDIDSIQNGSFLNGDTVIVNSADEINVEVLLKDN